LGSRKLNLGEGMNISLLLLPLIDRYLEDTEREYKTLDAKPEVFAQTDRNVKSIIFIGDHDLEKKKDALKLWMQRYGILQGLLDLGGIFAEVSLSQFERWNDQGKVLSENELLIRFNELNETLTNSYSALPEITKDRSFLSMTSKLLWLQYPNSTPIYDQNANIAINVLWKIYKSIECSQHYEPSNGSKYTNDKMRKKVGISKSEYDQVIYADYSHKYFALFNPVSDYIENELQNFEIDLEPIRYFDRVLWMLGSRTKDAGVIN